MVSSCQPIRQEFMENECEALPGVAYPGVRDNRSTINTKTGYDDMMSQCSTRLYVATRAVSALMKAIAATGQIAGFTGPG